MTDKSPARFSYLIRPLSPCIFGGQQSTDDEDEFFLTTGGIIYSCPNIYELAAESEHGDRKVHSCDHLKVLGDAKQPLSTEDDLNHYDREFSRYSILPRFQPLLASSSIVVRSTDSLSSEMEFDQTRHLIGLSQSPRPRTLLASSLLPSSWKSDNYLVVLPVVTGQRSNDDERRSCSFHLPRGKTTSSNIDMCPRRAHERIHSLFDHSPRWWSTRRRCRRRPLRLFSKLQRENGMTAFLALDGRGKQRLAD